MDQQKKYKEININKKFTLIISKELQSQIMYLHNKVEDIEWSGILFHSIVSGNINDPENLILKAENFYLKDIGTTGYTEFENDDKIWDFYEAYPKCENYKMSLLHSHHNMTTFFSGTDMQELHDNADKYNYYLSLIVNHKSQFSAKIAIPSKKVEGDYSYIFEGFEGKEEIKIKGKELNTLLLIDANIEFEQDEFNIKQYELIKKGKESFNYTIKNNQFTFNFGIHDFDPNVTIKDIKNNTSNEAFYKRQLYNILIKSLDWSDNSTDCQEEIDKCLKVILELKDSDFKEFINDLDEIVINYCINSGFDDKVINDILLYIIDYFTFKINNNITTKDEYRISSIIDVFSENIQTI